MAHLAGAGVDVLEVTILGDKAVKGVIALGVGANEAGEGVGGELTGEVAGGINIANVDLDGGVVLGGNDAVGGRALAGDVKVNELARIVLHWKYLLGDGEGCV